MTHQPPHRESPAKVTASMVLAAVFIIGGPIYAIIHQLNQPAVVSPAEQRAALEAAMPKLDLMSVATGKRLYDASCAACHAADGHGVPNLGRDLVKSKLARGLSDDALLQVIIHGRGPAIRVMSGRFPCHREAGATILPTSILPPS